MPDKYSPEGVLWQDIVSVLGRDVVDQVMQAGTEFNNPYESGEVLDVEIVSLSSTGKCITFCKESHISNTRPYR
jgi:tRNA (uracil-5-)-methyltransferase